MGVRCLWLDIGLMDQWDHVINDQYKHYKDYWVNKDIVGYCLFHMNNLNNRKLYRVDDMSVYDTLTHSLIKPAEFNII